jgi:hypothetical protein
VLEPGQAQLRGGSTALPASAASPGSRAVAVWLDHYAPWVLAIEFAIMLVTGVLAMVTDPWFTPKAKPKTPA